VDTAEDTLQENKNSAQAEHNPPVLIEPDLDFILALHELGNDSFKKCFQCGTCSAVCALSKDPGPFPAKQMSWAAWGMKDQLFGDPDVWSCHQCNDCSARCPRKARPGDLLAAVRELCVLQYSFPRFLGRWVNRPRYIPILLGFPALLLGLLILMIEPVEKALNLSSQATDSKIIFPFSSHLPHFALNSFFLFFGLLTFAATLVGVMRFWRTMKKTASNHSVLSSTKPLLSSIGSVLIHIVWRKNLAMCTKTEWRFSAHLLASFGFVSLFAVALWVINLILNPLTPDGFTYPLSFWSPWKILANLGGLALVAGCLLMIWNRLKKDEQAKDNGYFSWFFISLLLLVATTGFVIEIMHYARMIPHRHIAYFIHLVLVFALLFYAPYSKFAHLIYRFTAMVFVERSEQTKSGEKQ